MPATYMPSHRRAKKSGASTRACRFIASSGGGGVGAGVGELARQKIEKEPISGSGIAKVKELYAQDPTIDQYKLDKAIFDAFDLNIDDYKAPQEMMTGAPTSAVNDLQNLPEDVRQRVLMRLTGPERDIARNAMGEMGRPREIGNQTPNRAGQ
jgi:hypothetical protein